ncbi:hypothetical protein BDV18DRAFT_146591 [Aspergillus unguis]
MHPQNSEEKWQEEVLQAPPISLSQSYTVEQLKEDLLPLGHHDSSITSDLPETTPSRRRASTLAQSLDKDEYLPAKISFTGEGGTKDIGPDQATVLYLAYGSNLASATFLGSRGIRPLSQIGVTVPGLRLTFDLPGVPYLEPCFAATQFRATPSDDNVNPDSADIYSSEKQALIQPSNNGQDRYRGPLIGVVYEVTLTDYAKIIATEGGGRGYKDIVMTCYPFPENYNPADPISEHPGTQPFKAHTLLSPTGLQELKQKPRCAQPSARYLNLITTGAAEHNLPLAYRKYLAQIQPYRITSIRQRIGMMVLVVTWAPLFLITLGLGRIFARPDGRSPEWLGRVQDFVSTSMWCSYDNVLVHIFGDGERTVER